MKSSVVKKAMSLILCVLLTLSLFTPAVSASGGQGFIEVLPQGIVVGEPATEEPATEESVTEEPIVEEPAPDEPVSDEPIEEEPVETEPSNEASEEDALNAEAPVMSAGTTVNVSSVTALRTALENASSDSTAPTIIKLKANISVVADRLFETQNCMFYVATGKYIVLDLNGYTIKANGSLPLDDDTLSPRYLNMFGIDGNLTVDDSSVGKKGGLKGTVVMFNVNAGATITINAGKIDTSRENRRDGAECAIIVSGTAYIYDCEVISYHSNVSEGGEVYLYGGDFIGVRSAPFILSSGATIYYSNNADITNEYCGKEETLSYYGGGTIKLLDSLTKDVYIYNAGSSGIVMESSESYEMTQADVAFMHTYFSTDAENKHTYYDVAYSAENKNAYVVPSEETRMLRALEAGNDYTLTEDVIFISNVALSGNHEATLNLNGHTLSFMDTLDTWSKEYDFPVSYNLYLADGYKLTVCSKNANGEAVTGGELNFTSGGITISGEETDAGEVTHSSAELTLDGVTVTGDSSADIGPTEENHYTIVYILKNYGTLTVKNSSIISNTVNEKVFEGCIFNAGNITSIENSTISNSSYTAIQNGEYYNYYDRPAEHVDAAIASITDSQISAAGSCAISNYGTIELIKDTEITTSEGTDTWYRNSSSALEVNVGGRIGEIGEGTVINSSCTGIYLCSYYDETVNELYGVPQIDLISGGTFTTEYACLEIYGGGLVSSISGGTFTTECEYNSCLNIFGGGLVSSITGGTFNGTDTALSIIGGKIGEISGGVFNAERVAAQCNAEYNYDEQTGSYTIGETGIVESITGGTFTGGYAALCASEGDFLSVTGGSFTATGFNRSEYYSGSAVNAPALVESVQTYKIDEPNFSGETPCETKMFVESTPAENPEISANEKTAPSRADEAMEVMQNLYNSPLLGFGFLTYSGDITFAGDVEIEGYTTDLQSSLPYGTGKFILSSMIEGDGYSICTDLGEKNGGVIMSGTNSYTLTQSDLEKLDYIGSSDLALDTVNNVIKLNLVATKSLRLNETAITVAVGETYPLSKIVTPENATGTVEWSSSNTAVATVSKTGVVTAVGIGTAKITVEAYNGKKATCTVTVKQGLSEDMITLLEGEEYEYTGFAIKPTYTISNNTTLLVLNKNYTLSYVNNINVASSDSQSAPSLVFTGKGDYTGTVAVSFSILPKTLTNDMLEDYQTTQYYTGGAIEPFALKNGSIALVYGTDYTVGYDASNVDVGAKTALIEGIGNYTGTLTKQFEIVATPLDASMIAAIPAQEFIPGHGAVEPTLKIAYGVTWLVEGEDFTVSYSSNTGAGTATATVLGTGNFVGEVSVPYVIKTRALSKTMPEAVEDQTYTGEGIEPVVVKDGDVTLVEETDYTVSYKSNVNMGTATATIKGINSYKGTVTVKFKIVAKELAVDAIDVIENQPYTGSQIKPTLTVTDDLLTLKLNKDYTVKYTNNINAGTATVTITGKGNYKGTASADFTIDQRVTTFTVSPIKAQTYSGGELKPAVTVKDGKKTLKAGVDYVTEYSENLNVGTANVRVTGAGNYAESCTVSTTFTINPVALSKTTIVVPSHIQNHPENADDNKATPVITFVRDTLVENTDYTLLYEKYDTTGTASVTITGVGNFTGTVKKSYKIVSGKVLDDCVFGQLGYRSYSGSQLKPIPVIEYNETQLLYGTDFKVSGYKNNINVGTATATVTGIGEYTGTKTVTFNICSRTLEAEDVVINSISDKVYTGKEIKPSVTIKWNTKTLKPGIDYILRYRYNIDVGSATVTIHFKGNYYGILTETFDIVPYSVSKLSMSAIKSQYYTGSAITPQPVVKYGKTTLALTNDYTLAYSNNTAIGKATVTVTGAEDSNFTGSKTINFSIAKHPISASDVTVSGVTAEVTYDGSAKLQSGLTLTYSGDTLTNGEDYTVKYSNNVKVGTAKITISGKGDYFTGSKTVTFKIVGKEFNATLSESTLTYDGKALKPAVTATENEVPNTTLKLNRDYTVAYKNNTNAGTATVIVTGKGNYAGCTKTLSFDISPKTATLTIGNIKDQTYDGNAKRLSLTVKDGSKTLKLGVDYVVGYTYNTYAGKAQVTVTGIGNYSSSSTASKTFNIVMPKMKIASVKNNANGQVLVTWKTVPGAGGYVIEYATNKNFTENKQTVSPIAGDATFTTVEDLRVRTTYYFRIALLDDNQNADERIQSPYSSISSVKITK